MACYITVAQADVERTETRANGKPWIFYHCKFETAQPIGTKLSTTDYVTDFSECTKNVCVQLGEDAPTCA
jgi:hypothetical protein